MENCTMSALLAIVLAGMCSLVAGFDLKQFCLLFVAWYFYLRIGDRLDALTIAVESLQDALQRIEPKNDTPTAEKPPVPNAGTPIWDLVIVDMKARDHVGRQRYGTPLQAHNGRDALQDAYEEALDLAVYLRQAIEERKKRL